MSLQVSSVSLLKQCKWVIYWSKLWIRGNHLNSTKVTVLMIQTCKWVNPLSVKRRKRILTKVYLCPLRQFFILLKSWTNKIKRIALMICLWISHITRKELNMLRRQVILTNSFQNNYLQNSRNSLRNLTRRWVWLKINHNILK